MKHFDAILTCNYSPWSQYSGGGQKSTHALATALSESGLQICVVFSKAPWEKIRVPHLSYQVRWAFFFAIKPGISSIFRYLNGISFFFLIRKISSPDTVLHSNGEEGSLLGFIKNKKKFIYTNRYPKFDTYLNHTNWSKKTSWLRIFFREPRFAAMALALRHADAITVTSQFSINELHLNFKIPAEVIRCIGNGVDPVFFKVSPSPTPGGILYFGRITRAKGVDILVEAYASIPESLRGKHPLVIAGQGPYEKQIRTAIKKLNLLQHVKWHSWCEAGELARLISLCKIVVLPSREESFGNTMLETLAVGATLITTKAGSVPEVVGPYGILVNSGDANLLSEVMRKALEENTSQSEINKRKNYVAERYSWKTSAREFIKLYGIKPNYLDSSRA